MKFFKKIFVAICCWFRGTPAEKFPRFDGDSRPGVAPSWDHHHFGKLVNHLRLMIDLIPDLEKRTWMSSQFGELVAVKVSAQELLKELEKVWNRFARVRRADYFITPVLDPHDLDKLISRVALQEAADRGLLES